MTIYTANTIYTDLKSEKIFGKGSKGCAGLSDWSLIIDTKLAE